ncbi:Uncharacterized protein TCM_041168 [Theobroma cacao]|uniref:Uncharacterized protein n=1 Tax=Theobroma cacao TaxID=3641 RepID=A0A061GUZ3_THECC|nr:Uncharacterized protein TCM_041168 [Theobroma cacao]
MHFGIFALFNPFKNLHVYCFPFTFLPVFFLLLLPVLWLWFGFDLLCFVGFCMFHFFCFDLLSVFVFLVFCLLFGFVL